MFVNDIPIHYEKNPEQKIYKKYIPLFEKYNNIHIETLSGNAMAKSKLFIKSEAKRPPKGNLYILSIGVKNFTHLKNKNLQYTTNDAQAISKLFESQKENYNFIHTKILTDEEFFKPTKANILDSLSFLKNAEAKDTVILFLASHGVSDVNGEYYFLPQDAKESDLLKLSKPNSKINSLVPWSAFFDTLKSTLGKRILIVDTCESKNISGTYELYSLIKRSSSSKFAIVTASKGDEYSQEYSQSKHGLFTYGLLEAFKGKGDINQDKSISLKEAFNYASNIVKEKHDRRYGSQTPQISGTKSLFDTKLTQISQ